METLRKLKLPIQIAKYAGRQLIGGAFGELGDRYGAAMGGHLAHKTTIPGVHLAAAPETGQGYYLPPTEAA